MNSGRACVTLTLLTSFIHSVQSSTVLVTESQHGRVECTRIMSPASNLMGQTGSLFTCTVFTRKPGTPLQNNKRWTCACASELCMCVCVCLYARACACSRACCPTASQVCLGVTGSVWSLAYRSLCSPPPAGQRVLGGEREREREQP